jgi:hypothetical protein
MNNLQNSVNTKFKQLQTLHIALMLGALLMGSVLWFLIKSQAGEPSPINWLEGFPLYALIIMVVQVAASTLLWSNRQSKLPSAGTADEKWAHFSSSCILRWACLDGGILVSIVLAYLALQPEIFAISAAGLVLLFLARPSKEYLSEKYGLDAY